MSILMKKENEITHSDPTINLIINLLMPYREKYPYITKIIQSNLQNSNYDMLLNLKFVTFLITTAYIKMYRNNLTTKMENRVTRFNANMTPDTKLQVDIEDTRKAEFMNMTNNDLFSLYFNNAL